MAALPRHAGGETHAQRTGPVLQAWVLGQGAAERVHYTQDWRVHLLPLPSGAAAEPQSLACPGTHGTARRGGGRWRHAAAGAGLLRWPRCCWPHWPTGAWVKRRPCCPHRPSSTPSRRWPLPPMATGWPPATTPARCGRGNAACGARLDRPGLGRRVGAAPRHGRARPWPSTLTPSLLASVGDDRSARVWRLDSERGLLAEGGKADDGSVVKPMEQLSHDRPVLRVRWVRRSDDQHKLMTVSDKRVIFSTNATTSDQRRHDDWVMDADVGLMASCWFRPRPTARRGCIHPQRHAHGRIARPQQRGAARLLRPGRPGVHRQRRPHAATLAHCRAGGAGCRRPLAGERPQPARRSGADLRRSPHEAGAKARPGNAPARQCRIAPLADLGRRDQADDERLEAAPADTVSAGSWRHDGSQVLALADTHDIYARRRPVLWDAATRRRITPDWLQRWTTAAFNPLRPELVTSRRGGADAPEGELAVWAVAALAEAEPTPLLRLRGPTGHLAPAISADGRWLATADDNDVLLWDRQAAQAPPLRLRGHAGTVRSLAFSADSQALLSASGDRIGARLAAQGGGRGRVAAGRAAVGRPQRRGDERGVQPRWPLCGHRRRQQRARVVGRPPGLGDLGPAPPRR
ncbi:hypothetical protein PEC18_37890 [Paucibacter sp. O1-1]|nr:hypothetical protein [Paucibacter sp. O1-1]MDA3831400.1 hypothetical protein [Paucibacter sp. O1-1]